MKTAASNDGKGQSSSSFSRLNSRSWAIRVVPFQKPKTLLRSIDSWLSEMSDNMIFKNYWAKFTAQRFEFHLIHSQFCNYFTLHTILRSNNHNRFWRGWWPFHFSHKNNCKMTTCQFRENNITNPIKDKYKMSFRIDVYRCYRVLTNSNARAYRFSIDAKPTFRLRHFRKFDVGNYSRVNDARSNFRSFHFYISAHYFHPAWK